MRHPLIKMILIAGMLDITAACIQAYITRNTTPDVVLKYIASGLLGQDAFSGGVGVQLLGLVIHFAIVSACAITFFLVYPRIGFLKASVFLNAFLIAIIAWTITARIIIPFSKINAAPFDVSRALMAVVILYVCVGMPIAVMTKRFY